MREVIGDNSARKLREVLRMRTGLLAHAGEIGITLAERSAILGRATPHRTVDWP